MDRSHNVMRPTTSSSSKEREERVPGQKPWRRFLWRGVLLGTCLVLLLSIGVIVLQKRSQPLRVDPNTLYLATSSEDLSISSLSSQWHWQELNLPGAFFVVAPYHPTDEALEVDAQIKDPDPGFQNDDAFGIVIGMDIQGAGYVCGVTLNQPIAGYPGWDDHTIKSETTSGVYGHFADYVTVTVTIRQNVITLLYDGKLVAQASVTDYHADGLIGLFSTSGVKVQGFRIERLS